MTRKYTKAEAIGIVVRCAQTYKQELDGKNLLFICTDKHKKTIPIELSFYGNNYLHLTGLKAPKSENGDIAVELFANDFYQKCLDHKLSPTDFDFAEDGTTHMKLDVLPTVISKATPIHRKGCWKHERLYRICSGSGYAAICTEYRCEGRYP